MKPIAINNSASTDTKPGYVWITIGAAIPVFIAAFFYTDARMRDAKEITAFLITFFFMLGVYAGRFASMILVDNKSTFSKSIFIKLAVIILISVIAVFFMAAVTRSMGSDFMAFLFMGIPLMVLSISTGMLIKLIRVRVRSQITEARADAAQSQSELQLLQSQLSPHFLFNTLNNIYGISLSRHEKVPPLLLKLSELLRYSVYDARELFVPLVSELAYMQNYIEFEKIRVGEKLVLTTEIETQLSPQIRIAPLLLIVFIENAFKHAKNTTDEEIRIDIQLKTWSNNILFSVKNSNNKGQQQSAILNAHSGFGLESVHKRLALLYPNAHELSIQDDEKSYTVMLQLKTK